MQWKKDSSKSQPSEECKMRPRINRRAGGHTLSEVTYFPRIVEVEKGTALQIELEKGYN